MTLALNESSKPHLKRWSKQEYYDLVDRGVFRGQRVFLFRGELIEMPPMGALHAIGIANVSDWLYETFRPDHRIRVQMPFETPGVSVPEPDAAVVTNDQMLRRPHPAEAIILIEVSDSSLELDHEKAAEYAGARVAEYWIVNVPDRCVEVYRQPVVDASAPHGYRYGWHHVYRVGDSIASLARPDVSVTVARLVAVS